MAASSESPVPMSQMVAVVGQQFFSPDTMALTVSKKPSASNGDYVVSDVNGIILLNVEGRLFSLTHCRVLCDAAGTSIISMRKEPFPFSMHQRCNVYRGNSNNQRDLLFTVKKARILQSQTELNVYLARNTAEQHCDFKVKGSWFERSWIFYLGDSNTIIAHMSCKFELKSVLLGMDTFKVTVYPNVDYAFIVAIIVILDEMHREY
ncbi:hypothetical protein LUZ61_001019 [Rhynchospora tenuis]|uniref:Uncharacterized protein n=1 Tax=Rhynchospora tenuis TaxID=198213 RepID=A0AAD6EQE1_9POAL|nr:hypothetical protein LUZ61_001019 [Rhynchospora tenuis]